MIKKCLSFHQIEVINYGEFCLLKGSVAKLLTANCSNEFSVKDHS